MSSSGFWNVVIGVVIAVLLLLAAFNYYVACAGAQRWLTLREWLRVAKDVFGIR